MSGNHVEPLAEPPGLVLIEEMSPLCPRTGFAPVSFFSTKLFPRGFCLATLSRIGSCAANRIACEQKNRLPKITSKNETKGLFMT
jgi:hypothetical protein